MRHPRLKTALRYLGIGLLSLVGLIVVAVSAAIVVVRTPWGQQKLLTMVLPLANKALTGRLEIGGIGGDIFHRLIVREIKLYDAEQQLAVSVSSIDVRYNLLALLHKNVRITGADVANAYVRARFLGDGRLNLAALTKPSKSKGGPLPVTITASDVVVDLAAQFEPKAGSGVPAAGVQLRLEAAAQIADPRFSADIKTLKIHASDPLVADVELHGGATFVNNDTPQVEAHELSLLVRTTGEQVNRLVPAAELLGSWELSAAFRGPLTALGIELALRPPKGLLTVRGNVGVLDPKLPWQLAIDGHGIDPSAARQDVPAASFDVQIDGHGQGPAGRVDIRQLALKAIGSSLAVHGFAEGNANQPIGFPLPKGIAAQLAVTVDAPDLKTLLGPFVPRTLRLGGALHVQAQAVADQGQLRIDADVGGQHLQAAGNAVERLTLSAHTVDLAGKVKLHAEVLRTPLRLERFDLDATMSQEYLTVHALGRDGKLLAFELAVAGQPRLRGKELLGMSLNLNQLFLSRGGQRLDLLAPAHINLDMEPPPGPIIDLDKLALGVGAQRLTLGGHFEAKSQRFRATVDGRALDAQQWARLFGVLKVPQTWIDLHVQAAGTPRDPEGSLELHGTAAPMKALHLPRSEAKLDVTLHAQRIRGALLVQMGEAARGNERPRADLRFDGPLGITGPLTVDLDAQTLAQDWQDLLPGKLRALRGLIALHSSVHGTLQHPELELTVRAPAWQVEPLRGRNTALRVLYEKERFALMLDTLLASSRDPQLGSISVKGGTDVRLSLGPNLSPADIKRQVMHNPLALDVLVSHVDVPKVLEVINPGKKPPLQAGIFDLTLHVAGEPLAPKLNLNLTGQGIAMDTIKNLSIGTTVVYDGNDLRADVNAGLPKQPLLTGHAETSLPMAKIMSGAIDPKKQPVVANLTVSPLELSQISKVKGSITARAEVKGTLTAPELVAWVRSQRVQFDNTTIGPLAVDVTLDDKRLLKATVDAQQPGGMLKLTAQTQVPPKADTLKVNLAAKNFRIDYNPKLGAASLHEAIGMARGVLNADLKVQGTDWGASTSGFLKLENGGLMMKALAQQFSDIFVDIQIDPEKADSRRTVVNLKEVRLVTNPGRAKVSGNVQLDGLKLSTVSLDAESSQFPVWAGVLSLWIDSSVKIRAKTNGDTLFVDVNMPSGGVRLPKIESARSVQALGPLEDVRLVDAAAQQVAEAQAKEAAEKQAKANAAPSDKQSGFLPANIRVTAQLPDALHVSGPEVRADLTGRITMSLDKGGQPRIVGQVRNAPSWGWVEILHRRYEINRIETSLSGENPPNPLINVEISRKLDDATVFIRVAGTAKKPRVTFRSEPPLYDESQIIAIILTGQSGSSKKDPQAMGILSSLLIGQLRDQLADRLPIDVLRVDVAGDDPMGVGQSSVEVGKYLRDDVYLGYKRRFGGATTGMRRTNADEVLLEYQFWKAYKLKTMYGDANVGAIDLLWTKRF